MVQIYIFLYFKEIFCFIWSVSSDSYSSVPSISAEDTDESVWALKQTQFQLKETCVKDRELLCKIINKLNFHFFSFLIINL